MSDFRKIVLGLVACFGIPWLFMIVIPAIKLQTLKPLAYNKDADGMDGYYPPMKVQGQGELIYAREGCVQCHTQMIRGVQFGLDGWRKGWGEDQEARPAEAVRSTTLRDYFGEQVAFLGIQRAGPDLANVGWRITDRNKLHQLLYAPKSINDWSIMPAMKHLYKVQPIQGPKSDRALDLPQGFKPAQGTEVVPTVEAEQLVDYLLSLKRAYPIPGMSAAVAASSSPAAPAK